MAKTYSYYAPGKRLTAKGGTTIDPITFADLYAADQANGWNVVHYYGQNTYHLDCLLYLGDNTTPTYFIDANKLIVFTDEISGSMWNNIIYLYSNAHIQLGDLVNEENKDVNNGCVIQVNAEASYDNWLFIGSVTNTYRRIYGCTIITPNNDNRDMQVNVRGDSRLWHCSFVNYVYPWVVGDADIYRLTLTGGTDYYKTYGFFGEVGSPVIDDFVATNVGMAIRACLLSSDLTIRRMKATNEKTVIFDAQNKDLNLIDCEFTNWIVHSMGPTTPGKTLRKYSVNLNISDKDGVNLEGANVKCYDKNNDLVFDVNTDAEGSIVEQECIYQEWFQLSIGWHGEEDATCYSPHKFIISKSGKETLEIDNITLDEKINWHLELQEPVTCDYPAIEDVEKDVTYDSGNKTGIFVAPAEADVKKDIGYGALGTEFLGTLVAAGLFLRGINLKAKLEENTNLRAQLEKNTNMRGVMREIIEEEE